MTGVERPRSIVIYVVPKVYAAIAAIPNATMWFVTDAGENTIPIAQQELDGKQTIFSISTRSPAAVATQPNNTGKHQS